MHAFIIHKHNLHARTQAGTQTHTNLTEREIIMVLSDNKIAE